MREETLNDIITGLQPGLFERVTNLRIDDFALLLGQDFGFNFFNAEFASHLCGSFAAVTCKHY